MEEEERGGGRRRRQEEQRVYSTQLNTTLLASNQRAYSLAYL